MSVQIKENTKSMAEVLKKSIEIDPKTGEVKIDKDAYVKSLPEGLTAELYSQFADHDTTFAAGAVLAAGEMANELGKKLKADKLEFNFPMVGKDSFGFTWHKRRESVNPQNPEEKIVKHGAIGTPAFTIQATKNSGQLAAVRTHISEDAANIFAN